MARKQRKGSGGWSWSGPVVWVLGLIGSLVAVAAGVLGFGVVSKSGAGKSGGGGKGKGSGSGGSSTSVVKNGQNAGKSGGSWVGDTLDFFFSGSDGKGLGANLGFGRKK